MQKFTLPNRSPGAVSLCDTVRGGVCLFAGISTGFWGWVTSGLGRDRVPGDRGGDTT